MNREHDLRKFYSLLARQEEMIGGKRVLAACSGRMDWPRRGVYFFFQNGEPRADSGDGPRVVRVGTHALTPGSKTTLWNRLAQHRGTQNTGGGNHRGSIFRLIVGTALAHPPTSWGHGSFAPKTVHTEEAPHEQRVSEVIRAMPFLWLGVEDESGPASLRGLLERNAIALLSNYGRAPIDPPSAQWLGHACNREKVRNSGLWNQNHVEERYDRGFLDVMERLISGAAS